MFADLDGMGSCVKNQFVHHIVTLTMGSVRDLESASVRWDTMVKTVINVTNSWDAVAMVTVKRHLSANVVRDGKVLMLNL